MARKTRTNKTSIERKLGFDTMKWLIGCLLAGLIAVGIAQHNLAAEKKSVARANSSTIAQTATPVEAIQTLPGFKIERLYSVPADKQGSWVALTVDDKGRLIASDQYGAVYRITPAAI